MNRPERKKIQGYDREELKKHFEKYSKIDPDWPLILTARYFELIKPREDHEKTS